MDKVRTDRMGMENTIYMARHAYYNDGGGGDDDDVLNQNNAHVYHHLLPSY